MSSIPEDKGYLRLPFDTKSVHRSISEMVVPFDRSWVQEKPSWLRNIRVQIIPNGIQAISKTYQLSLSTEGQPEEGPRGDDEVGLVRLWHGRVQN